MGVSLDISKCHRVRKHGEIVAMYTWVNDERALVLAKYGNPKSAGWYIILEPAAYKYDDERYLAEQARKAAEIIGLEYSTGAWFKIATIIHDGLEELIRMPSAPERELMRQNFGIMKAFEGSTLLREEDIRFEKQSGAEFA
jgi:hypothetical protein